MNLTDEQAERILDELYTIRWYCSNKIPDSEQRELAEAHISLAVALMGGAPLPSKDSEPVPPITVPDFPEAEFIDPDWMFSGGSFPIVGYRFTPAQFLLYAKHIADTARMTWSPIGCTAHHTAAPSLAQRPNGLIEQHMRNLRSYYKDSLGWSCGPHIFTDDNGIWVFSPLQSRGIHARSFNNTRFGIEMLGDFDNEDPNSDRAKKSIYNGQFAIAALLKAFGLQPDKINFHRHDPLTSKSCPGTKIDFDKFESACLEIYQQLPA